MNKFVFAAVVIVCCTQAAYSHSKKESTVPDDGAIITSVDTIELQFDDPMRVTAISLTGPVGEVEITRKTGFEPTTHFIATVPPDVQTGEYTVEWRGLASDGHPMQGSYSFAIAR